MILDRVAVFLLMTKRKDWVRNNFLSLRLLCVVCISFFFWFLPQKRFLVYYIGCALFAHVGMVAGVSQRKHAKDIVIRAATVNRRAHLGVVKWVAVVVLEAGEEN